MALKPTIQTPQPPPDVPSVPQLPDALANYLRSFSLWCRNQFAERSPDRQAMLNILMQASDAAPGTTPPVFSITVDHTGAIHTTAVPLGKAP